MILSVLLIRREPATEAEELGETYARGLVKEPLEFLADQFEYEYDLWEEKNSPCLKRVYVILVSSRRGTFCAQQCLFFCGTAE